MHGRPLELLQKLLQREQALAGELEANHLSFWTKRAPSDGQELDFSLYSSARYEICALGWWNCGLKASTQGRCRSLPLSTARKILVARRASQRMACFAFVRLAILPHNSISKPPGCLASEPERSASNSKYFGACACTETKGTSRTKVIHDDKRSISQCKCENKAQTSREACAVGRKRARFSRGAVFLWNLECCRQSHAIFMNFHADMQYDIASTTECPSKASRS